MKQLDTLSIPFYEFRCNDKLVDEIYPLIKNLSYRQGDTSTELSEAYFYHKELFDWFNECLEKVKQLYFDDNLKIVITTCWATKTLPLQKHIIHNHQQTLIAGIFYLDTFQSGETIFYNNNPWTRYQNEHIMNISTKSSISTKLTTKILPEKGKLILFPPQIYHGTSPNKDKKTRYTLAFDAFFSGKIYGNSNWPYVEINSTSLKDIDNSK